MALLPDDGLEPPEPLAQPGSQLAKHTTAQITRKNAWISTKVSRPGRVIVTVQVMCWRSGRAEQGAHVEQSTGHQRSIGVARSRSGAPCGGAQVRTHRLGAGGNSPGIQRRQRSRKHETQRSSRVSHVRMSCSVSQVFFVGGHIPLKPAGDGPQSTGIEALQESCVRDESRLGSGHVDCRKGRQPGGVRLADRSRVRASRAHGQFSGQRAVRNGRISPGRRVRARQLAFQAAYAIAVWRDGARVGAYSRERGGPGGRELHGQRGHSSVSGGEPAAAVSVERRRSRQRWALRLAESMDCVSTGADTRGGSAPDSA